MAHRVKTAVVLLLGATAGIGTQAPPVQAQAARPAGSCSALAGMRTLDGVTIASARRVPESAPNTIRISSFAPDTIPAAIPAYCLAEGMIDPHKGNDGKDYGLAFALALPENWNGRFLFQGGGGLNGTLNPPLGMQGAGDVPALARGFAVVSTDGGHKGAVFDAAFMNDQRAALDFYHRSVGRVTEVAKDIVARFYGRPANKSYIAGCSTGGREAMLGMQRYPDMFDGALAGAPAMRAGQSRIAAAWASAAFNKASPKDAAGKPLVGQLFSSADRKLLNEGVLNACDARDGLKDGLIFDPAGCRFDPAVLTCKGGKTDQCLSRGQVEALKAAVAGPKDSRGNQVYPGFWWDTGVFAAGPISFIPTAAPSPLGPPNLDQNVDVDGQLRALNNDPGERLTDTSFWTNLNGFTGHGGRVIFYHGVSDPWFSAQDTADYQQRVAKQNGDVSRLYLVPGMSHCQGGPAMDRFDLLTPLVEWVEQGRAPQSVTAAGAAFPGQKRPLCPYPAHAHYDGTGKPEDAASFTCKPAS